MPDTCVGPSACRVTTKSFQVNVVGFSCEAFIILLVKNKKGQEIDSMKKTLVKLNEYPTIKHNTFASWGTRHMLPQRAANPHPPFVIV